MTESGTVSKTTNDHETIKRWVADRGGKPAKVKGTGGGGDIGMIRFMFDEGSDALEEITWEQFFTEFDTKNLALLYQDKTKEGQPSRFFKFIKKR